MSLPEECESLTRAFSGFGVDEKSIIEVVGKWSPEETKTFRKGCTHLFSQDEHHLLEKWDTNLMALLKREFSRFKKAAVLWTMHPWERDARMVKESLMKSPQLYDVIIEIACTRSSEELLGARKAYHSLFSHSMEEDVAYHVPDVSRSLLVALVSAYRYEGSRVNEETAKLEAKTLGDAIKGSDGRDPIENEQVVRILSTRSKSFLKAICICYKEINGKTIFEDLEFYLSLRQILTCLCTPLTYFSELLDNALNVRVDEYAEYTKEALTRTIVCRADVDIMSILEEYQHQYGVSLLSKIQEKIHGNFKDFLVSLIARADK